jgi:DNA helicase-2/ATP-dependent DNA helicase PcrA
LKFIADLHIHSRFSRATSRSLDLTNLDYWAQRKGLAVVGTGDFTHPQWLAEIESQVVPAEEGLYRLAKGMEKPGCGQARFVLTAEISSIYKKDGRVRKVHSLILAPDLAGARALGEKLDRIGNVRSDGRPILGLDARDLLAICLDISPDFFFIPAHIWTPWFSLLGSKSGFDSVEECFEDLAPYIFALETGLSSDPAMNWRLSALDRYVLVSNSDAHSPDKLGREANLFDTDLSYPAMVKAMKRGGGFAGTLEFFPEEGKYHLDGHRKCDRRLDPEETRQLNGLCPVCGKPVTVGVSNRVLELADRRQGEKPPEAYPYHSLIPLTEVLGQIMGVGPASKRVLAAYEELITGLGPEIQILWELPLSEVERVGGSLLALGLDRMRKGQVEAEAGYDGEYGRIRLFTPGELETLAGQGALFEKAVHRVVKKTSLHRESLGSGVKSHKYSSDTCSDIPLLVLGDPLLDDINPEQRQAVSHGPGPLLVTAGPGTGKTMVLTRRMAWLIREGMADPEEVMGVTFTRRAAGEMAARLAAILPFRTGVKSVRVMTFHALGLAVLSDCGQAPPRVLSEEERVELARRAAKGGGVRPQELLGLISLAKQRLAGPGDCDAGSLAAAHERYEVSLAALGALDFDDLVVRAVFMLEKHADLAERWRRRSRWLLVDEYQDINLAQYRLTNLLAVGPEPNLTVIGDPDQAIYGFRGADSTYFERFNRDFPGATLVRLSRNYRSTDTILKASNQVIGHNRDRERQPLESGRKGPAKITTAVLSTPAAEAEYVVRQIEKLLGGTSHFALDSGRVESRNTSGEEGSLGLADVAILYRLHNLAQPMAAALEKAGLPFQQAGTEPIRETDDLDFTVEKISLLTMHAAKGLEFKVVFVIGLEEGVLPYVPPKKASADEAEERRLFFVALTRAKRHLFLTRALSRTLYGKKSKSKPCPFLDEISAGLKALDKLPDRAPRVKARQLDLF